MGLVGRHATTFAEANLAEMVGVHMNGDYDFFYDVVKVEKRTVTVKSHKTGAVTTHRIVKGRAPYEYFVVHHSGIFQRLFGRPKEKIRVVPFKGERT